jgi:hypothetical protein
MDKHESSSIQRGTRGTFYQLRIQVSLVRLALPAPVALNKIIASRGSRRHGRLFTQIYSFTLQYSIHRDYYPNATYQ